MSEIGGIPGFMARRTRSFSGTINPVSVDNMIAEIMKHKGTKAQRKAQTVKYGRKSVGAGSPINFPTHR
ncbi:MAG: hypothetical protein RLZZ338_4775 [Cyanobacteriota bacterium]|jgi:hypothetical protein